MFNLWPFIFGQWPAVVIPLVGLVLFGVSGFMSDLIWGVWDWLHKK
ncbi:MULTISPECIES: hypothetical protein [Liquorilactobacillus]|nr:MULTISPECIES: hypothetical protein [Liquorilactobacillus]